MLIDMAAAQTVEAAPPVLDAPLPGWRPHRLDNGDWGSIYLGDTSALPSELVGANIVVQSILIFFSSRSTLRRKS